MSPALAGLFGRHLSVLDLGIESVPAIRFHKLKIDAACRLFAISHCVRNVGSSGHQVAAGIEPRTTGLESEPVHIDGSVLFEDEARRLDEVKINGFADGKNHRIAIDPLDLVR